MQYRKFGRLDWQVSALGFGAMRLPTTDGNQANIVEYEAIDMIRHAIDQGVNYVDTAWPYHHGQSEVVVGKALQDGYREKVRLATKSPIRFYKHAEDFERFLTEQLSRLQTEQIDFYLLHGLNKNSWEQVVLKYDLLQKAEAAKKDGRIRYLGFSFHDDLAAFKEIVDGHQWDFCQIQYNYMDTENQAGRAGLQYAAAQGLAVVIMEPLLGGKLVKPPQDITALLHAADPTRSPVDWALQWLWNQPEVSVVLSGMSTMEQVQQNLQAADKSGVNSFSEAERQLMVEARQRFLTKTAIPCTGCAYCMPCPNNIEIPRNFKTYNEGFMYDDLTGARGTYQHFLTEAMRAGSCLECRICEEKCPQGILISEWMPKVHGVLGEGKDYERN
ncbi:MAG TPA: aldo/keto reductase [Oscillospiraceae bacterium]|nr:aldo/keto reductase [Oscillospiraceae bacterium]